MKLLLLVIASASAFQGPKLTNKASRLYSSLFVDETRSSVQDYYGNTLQTSDDLQTNACCTGTSPPDYIQAAISNLHPETIAKYYGCGLCLPDYDLTGLRILDLGCGAGRDVYIASQLVGPTGSVVGVDMTEAQLEAARSKQSYHADKFGYSNVEFVQGYLENLDELDLGEFDLIISNCVINLVTDKRAVLSHCHNLLKEHGEFYFSDVYANRRVPQVLQDDPILWGECLSGALYWNDFENTARSVGFTDPRVYEDSPITVSNSTVQAAIAAVDANLQFFSATYRLFKMQELEPDCEDYGQAVIYKGTIPNHPSSFKLDKGHELETGKILTVCGNSYNMIKLTKSLTPHFEYIGDFSRHYGIFEGCGRNLPYDTTSAGGGGGDSGGSSCC